MLDTIKIYTSDFSLNEVNRFTKRVTERPGGYPDAVSLFYNSRHGIHMTINEDRKSGRLLLFVETSLPKLLYDTSYYEIRETDKEKVITLLTSELETAGVSLYKNIDEFKLSRVDFCRNILLDGKISEYLLFIQQFRMNRKKRRTYEGQTVTFLNNTSELEFYDKIAEIAEKNNKNKDKRLRFIHEKRVIGENTLRIERRLKSNKKIVNVLGREYSLSELFDSQLCTKVILEELNLLVKDIGVEDSVQNLSNYELADKLRRDGVKRPLDRLLRVLGIGTFVSSMEYDWAAIDKFCQNYGYSNRGLCKIRNRIQQDYFRFHATPENRDYLKEIKNKIEFQAGVYHRHGTVSLLDEYHDFGYTEEEIMAMC